jgi:hypothetical protein
MRRRDFLASLALTAGADFLAFGRAIHAQPLPPRPARVLSAHAEQTITLAAERILPATDTPGATDANVSAFIEKMLADWHTPEERQRFLVGLAELDARCQARASRSFVDCSENDQIAVLNELDALATRSSEPWFARLKYLTVYGYCTSEVGMRALGLWPQPWRYDGCAPLDAKH